MRPQRAGNSDYDRKVLKSGNNALPTSYSNNDFQRYSAAYYTATVPGSFLHGGRNARLAQKQPAT